MAKRTIAIGDVHGCSRALDTLLAQIAPRPRDELVVLGDFIDRGRDTRGVVERLLKLSGECRLVTLLGNHEVMMLSALKGRELGFWLMCGGEETVASYGAALDDVPPEHVKLIEGCVRYHETPDALFFHANYDPTLTADNQPDRLLLWEHLTHAPPEPHVSGKTVFIGHTPQISGEIRDEGHVVCLDTFCVSGGWLTGLDVNSRQIWQVDVDGNVRE